VTATNNAHTASLIDLEEMSVSFEHFDGEVRAVVGVNLSIPRRGCVSLLGESGCGKSVTAKSIIGILPRARVSGKILYHRDETSLDLTQLDRKGEVFRSIRGSEISMIFQEPVAALSPVHTVGEQVAEVLRVHRSMSAPEARAYAIDMFNRVGISDPARRANQYPFELSGGMCQRVMIAMALACRPRLLIADEPTTGLDVTIQAQILDLIREMQDEFQMAVLFITHDLGVVAEMADAVAVMYLGSVVEYGTMQDVFYRHYHPYTRGLLASMPIVSSSRRALTPIQGNVPPGTLRIQGCPFKTRCPHYMKGVCDTPPPNVEIGSGHFVRCWLYANEGTTV
jgi:oligopeptide/dipeptide ABC transporter ATP-binding protein